MFPVLNLGPLALPTAPLLLLLGIWFSTSAVERAAQRLGQPVNATYGVAAGALFGGLVGARLLFVVTHWAAFRVNLLGIIWPLNAGYDLWGGLGVGVLVGALLVRRHRLSPAGALDALAPGVVVLLIAVSLADFFGGSGLGTFTDLPWGLRFFDLPQRRHPVQLYEVVVGLLALGAWLRAERWVGGPAARALLTVAVYAAGRLFTEAFRANVAATPDGYRLLQLGCLLLMGGALFVLAQRLPQAAADPGD